jgi:hypothetical protein
MEILFKNKAVEDVMEEIVKQFVALRPHEAKAMQEYIVGESAHLHTSSGMSKDGTMRNYCKMPKLLYSFIVQQMRKRCGIPNFFASSSDYRLFLKIWSNAKMKTKKKAFLDIGGLITKI